MLRMMCRDCAKVDEIYYHERKKTGKVVKREVEGGRSKNTIQCSACGREWHYFGKKRK